MEKKSFRPKKPASPSYPLLREVDHNAISGWGLATLGSLLLGGAACTPAHADQPPPGEPPAARVEKQTDDTAVRPPDAGVPAGTAKLDRKADKNAGKSANQKSNKKDPKVDSKGHATAAGTAATGGSADATTKASDKPRMMGKMRMPRADEVAPEAKQTAPKK